MLASGFDFCGMAGKFLLGVALVIAVWFMVLSLPRSAVSSPTTLGYYLTLIACALGASWCFWTLFR